MTLAIWLKLDGQTSFVDMQTKILKMFSQYTDIAKTVKLRKIDLKIWRQDRWWFGRKLVSELFLSTCIHRLCQNGASDTYGLVLNLMIGAKWRNFCLWRQHRWWRLNTRSTPGQDIRRRGRAPVRNASVTVSDRRDDPSSTKYRYENRVARRQWDSLKMHFP